MKPQLSLEVDGHMLELVIQNSPAAIAVLRGPDFTYEMVNPAYRQLAPGELMVGRTVAAVWPHAAPRVIPILSAVRDTGTPHTDTELGIAHCGPKTPKDERYFDCSYVRLPPTEEDRILMVAVEVTRHKRERAELSQAYSELAAIYAHAPVVLFVVDHNLRVEKVNELAARFAGRQVADLLGQQPGAPFGCLNALNRSEGCGRGPDCAACSIRTAVIDSLTNGTPHNGVEAWMPRSDGLNPEPRCLLVSTSVMEAEPNRKVLVCAQDITELKEAQFALESALGEKTILVKEIHHRVKNNLAVVSSLLGMKADTVGSGEARSALEESRERVLSMALIHEQLYGHDRLDRIHFAEYAEQLVSRLHAAFVGEPGRVAVHLDLQPADLAIERAVPCGLILNELLTNAFKYAFQGRSGGRVAVSFRLSAPGILELTVEDDGVGLPTDHQAGGQTRNSLGLRIVEILASQLDGTLHREPCSGTRMVLRFPVVPAP